MTCDRCQALVGDYVDDTISADERSGVEAHLLGCDACRTMADDFGAIRRAARDLAPLVPPAHAWARLSASLEAERTRGIAGGRRSWVCAWRPAAIAATLVLLAGGSSWIVLRQAAAPAPPARATAAPAPVADPELVKTVETELRLAEEHYQKAIAGLEQITRTESATLDPQVAAVLQKNLDVIDHAIGESRAALHTQPASDVAQESLFEALRNKVALLQDTVVLINEMRKGNPEGTARVVSGLNQ
ncbi:MAG: zf-HC2 domain-containing protein [Vicinamibacterales bacterium]